MSDYALRTPETAPWHALLAEAERVAGCSLESSLQQYLVALLLRYFGHEQPMREPLPLALLRTGRAAVCPSGEQLREVADQCLIVAGIYPEQARHHQVEISRLVEVGQDAYGRLAESVQGPLFCLLAEHFVEMMDVLQTMRELDQGQRCLDPLSAYALWSATGSRYARRVLGTLTDGFPAPGAPSRPQ